MRGNNKISPKSTSSVLKLLIFVENIQKSFNNWERLDGWHLVPPSILTIPSAEDINL